MAYVIGIHIGGTFTDAFVADEDQLDQLRADSLDTGRVMAPCVHAFSVIRPFRQRYLD